MLWYLVLVTYGYANGTQPAITVIPSRYVNEQACENAGQQWIIKHRGNDYQCVAVPAEGEENG